VGGVLTGAQGFTIKANINGDTHVQPALLSPDYSHPSRPDNLLCAVLVLEENVMVKTVMHHFELI
jgi:hypothetical protein